MTARITWVALAVAVLGGGAWWLTRAPDSAVPIAEPAPAAARKVAAVSVSAPVAPATEAAPMSPDDVQRLIADANSGDAERRATAIKALARAPRAEAVPALRRLVMNGEPTVDRPLALNSLRELALEQGDADGAVRAAIREVIYHGDQDALMASAQESLDVVEESELR